MKRQATVPLTVVVLAKNEAQNLPRCLSSLEFAADMVVIDDYSDDGTVDVAKRHGARVYQNRFQSFADQRNWAMREAQIKTEWTLHLDADEVITPELASSIRQAVLGSSPETAGYFLCFKTIFHGQWLRFSSTFPVWILRLVRKSRVRYIPKGHGEGFEADGQLLRLNEPFLHFNFSKGLEEWFAKHNRYSSREAETIMNRESSIDTRSLFGADPVRRRRALKQLSWKLPLRPWLKFFYMYIVRLGLLDRRPGLTYCVLQSIYEYMICVKVRELRRLQRCGELTDNTEADKQLSILKGEHK